MKKFFAIAAVVALAAGGYLYFPHQENKSKDEAYARFIVPAKRRTIDYSIEVAGDVTPEVQLEVKSEVGGKVKAIHVEPGQAVKKGQLLCEIDDTDLRNEEASVITQLEGAQLSVERIQANFQRAKDLFKHNLITKENFDNLASDLAIAENSSSRVERQLQTVRDRIAKTKITSPTDGVVLEVRVVEGQVIIGASSVNNGTVLMNVADVNRLLLEAVVNQIDVARLKWGQEVTIRRESLSEQGMDGKIRFIAPVATTKNNVRGFLVRASILNPVEALKPGMTVNMTIPVARVEKALSVPITAVFRGDNDNRIVYRVANDPLQAEPVEVNVGVSNLEYVEITSGLNEGDRVLLVEPRLLNKKS